MNIKELSRRILADWKATSPREAAKWPPEELAEQADAMAYLVMEEAKALMLIGASEAEAVSEAMRVMMGPAPTYGKADEMDD